MTDTTTRLAAAAPGHPRPPPREPEPVPRGPSPIVRATLLSWIVIGSANLVLSQLPGIDLGEAILQLATTILGMGLSFALNGFVVGRHKAGRGLTFATKMTLAIGCGFALWTAVSLLRGAVNEHDAAGGWPWSAFVSLRLNLVYFCLLYAFQAAGSRMLSVELTLETRERQLLEARLAALRFQLNPHFIFNTLNAISTLVAEAGAKQAEEMIARLSDFLRASLVGEPNDLVALATEIDLVHAYLEIESIRFGDRLIVRYACDAGLAEALVPSFILQPLIENAVKYAVAPSKEPVTVSIEATRSGNDLVIVVEDDGRHRARAAACAGTGVGLRNIAARLAALYGASGRIEAVRREIGFIVVVRLPLTRLTDG